MLSLKSSMHLMDRFSYELLLSIWKPNRPIVSSDLMTPRVAGEMMQDLVHYN